MAASKKVTKVSDNWMRALILVLAEEQGFKHSQSASYQDVFTKAGTSPIVSTWGSGTHGHLLAISQGKTLIQGKGSMLQRLQTKLGKPMDLGKKWPKISPAKKVELVTFQHTRTKEVAAKA